MLLYIVCALLQRIYKVFYKWESFSLAIVSELGHFGFLVDSALGLHL